MQATETKQQYVAVYHIDNSINSVTKANINTNDFQLYINKVCIEDLNAKNKRSFNYKRETTELSQIIRILLSSINDSNFLSIFDGKVHTLAERLLDSQDKVFQKRPGINPPKKGSIAVVCIKTEEYINFLISKIDSENYINVVDSKYEAGLPEENATQKTCSISYKIEDSEYQLIEILVSDSNSTISNFWYDDFLELIELKSDQRNTTKAYNTIDKVLSSYVKKKSENDYTHLRNTLTGYFSTRPSFVMEDMIEYVIGSYAPETSEIDINVLKDKIRSLPDKKDFDSAFNIDKSVIKSRFKQTYKISEKMELRTNDYIDELRKTVIAKIDDKLGDKVLIIKNIDDKLYEKFKERE
ncbi:hypothetical protein M3599_23640 [Niallia circulans]|uniref:hypothetical protein n=1 Tax=Niallia circulans TaxID=1397 RepID=UPI00203D4E91|nr:hypothetical protein [Niallia circulans]MCM2983890.1 hypothetical protein [Niallia circulans]